MDKTLQRRHSLLNMEGSKWVCSLTTLCSNSHSNFYIPPWKKPQSPTTNLIKFLLWWMRQQAVHNFQSTILQPICLIHKFCCIKTGFVFMNIEFIPFNYYKFTYDWINRSDASHFPSSFQCPCFPHIFSSFSKVSHLRFWKSFQGVCLIEVDGKGISKDQVWIELKATLVTEILCIDTF